VKLGKIPNFCSAIHGEFDVDELNFGCKGRIENYREKLATVKYNYIDSMTSQGNMYKIGCN
jgi:hypothetical protein